MDNNASAIFFARKEFKMLGTDIDLKIVFDDLTQKENVENDLMEAFNIYTKIDKIFSRFDEKSELSFLNNNPNSFVDVSSEMIEVVSKSLLYHNQTEGYFDPRIISTLEDHGYVVDFSENDFFSNLPSQDETDLKTIFDEDMVIDVENKKVMLKKRIDLSGIVKGYVTDRVANFFSRQGWKNYYVDSGGDMFFAGKDENLNSWFVNIEGISSKNIIVDASDKAIATSGIAKRKWEKDGERYHHLINPKNPKEISFDLKSVTVIADCVEKADVWAKTIFIMGKEKALKWSQKENIPFLILYYSGSIFISKPMLKYIYENKIK